MEEISGWADKQATCSFVDIGDLITEERIQQYQEALQRAQTERAVRTANMRSIRDESEQLRLLLDIEEDEGSDSLTDTAMATNAMALQFLRDERQAREEKVRDLARQIAPLWDLLGIEMDERQSFFKAHVGLGQEVICAVHKMH